MVFLSQPEVEKIGAKLLVDIWNVQCLPRIPYTSLHYPKKYLATVGPPLSPWKTKLLALSHYKNFSGSHWTCHGADSRSSAVAKNSSTSTQKINLESCVLKEKILNVKKRLTTSPTWESIDANEFLLVRGEIHYLVL